MKKFKIVKTELFKEQEKELPEKVRKELDKVLGKLAENPYMGEPMDEGDMFEVACQILESEYGLEFEEVWSVLLSNQGFDVIEWVFGIYKK